MNQADVSRLVSQLKIKVASKPRRLKNPNGPEGRLDKLRQTITGLFKFERIELNYQRADEARGYSERLISEAIRHGDRHIPTMDMADFWLMEKQLIHKLFKVLVPRYQKSTVSFTRILKAPSTYPNAILPRAVLELKGNPFPPLIQDHTQNRNLLHNILLDAARKEYRHEQYMRIAQGMSSDIGKDKPPTLSLSEPTIVQPEQTSVKPDQTK